MSWQIRYQLAEKVGIELNKRHWTLAAAESCTGGGIAFALTQVPGSSAYFSGGVVAYSNQIKTQHLGVPQDNIDRHGAVSESVAISMSLGIAESFDAAVGISTTGIAGPGGGSSEKPVGTVCFGWTLPTDSVAGSAKSRSSISETQHFSGDRESVRQQSIEYSLKRLLQLL